MKWGDILSDKVILILCDGLRPDSVESCKNPFVKTLMGTCYYCGKVQTVFPSYTLPCHMSLMHSQKPDEHGVTGNIFVPAENGRHGLFEQLRDFKKTSAFFYSWGELRDICEPSSLSFGSFISSAVFGGEKAGELLSEKAVSFINEYLPDFAFLYLENTDIVGHMCGWESEEYEKAVDKSFGLIEKVLANIPYCYSFFITADHGGHGFDHGTDSAADMTIPLFVKAPSKEIDKAAFAGANIIDIAPSICDILGIPPSKNFRGKSLFKQ